MEKIISSLKQYKGIILTGSTLRINDNSEEVKKHIDFTRRCFEQVALDLCLHNLPVKLIGNGGGLVYAPLGPTHQAIEDIGILRTLPNMTIVAPCDADEMQRLMIASLDWPHPLYIRLAKGGDSMISKAELGF